MEEKQMPTFAYDHTHRLKIRSVLKVHKVESVKNVIFDENGLEQKQRKRCSILFEFLKIFDSFKSIFPVYKKKQLYFVPRFDQIYQSTKSLMTIITQILKLF